MCGFAKNNKINGIPRHIQKKKSKCMYCDTVTKETAHIKMPYFSL